MSVTEILVSVTSTILFSLGTWTWDTVRRKMFSLCVCAAQGFTWQRLLAFNTEWRDGERVRGRERANGEFLRWSVTRKRRERRKRSTAAQWTMSVAVARTAGKMRSEPGPRRFSVSLLLTWTSGPRPRESVREASCRPLGCFCCLSLTAYQTFSPCLKCNGLPIALIKALASS